MENLIEIKNPQLRMSLEKRLAKATRFIHHTDGHDNSYSDIYDNDYRDGYVDDHTDVYSRSIDD